MGVPNQPRPVKLFIAFLSNQAELFARLETEFVASLGDLDSASPIFSFTSTDYYREELGSGLLRKFVSFGALIPPERLAEIKILSHKWESEYQWVRGETRGRKINIDPGYLDANKVVLATTKDASHRVYLHSGIYAEAALRFHSGSFQPFDHTYPDYRRPEALAFFSVSRALYLNELRAGRSS